MSKESSVHGHMSSSSKRSLSEEINNLKEENRKTNETLRLLVEKLSVRSKEAHGGSSRHSSKHTHTSQFSEAPSNSHHHGDYYQRAPRQHRHHRQDRQVREPKVDLLHFHGRDDVDQYLDWELKVEQLFACHGKFTARNIVIVIRGVHDVATDTSAETRKLEGKLDALVNLVNQLATNQKPASVSNVCGIRSSIDHHTSVCPSSQQSRVDEHPEAYAANTYSGPPPQQRQGT
ncbi:hypothetical protein Fmac_028492 [Flemingia macrophylla]|uniref:Uncharacterized protein n=1 Tax=Flemingia macrophylla TaxID=520843 RepID=A0ABD1L814_9FABA